MFEEFLATCLFELEKHRGCPDSNTALREMREWWYSEACSEFAGVVDDDVLLDLRKSTFEMAKASADLVIETKTALATTDALTAFEQVFAVGSVARSEATKLSDVDLNIRISEEYAAELKRKITVGLSLSYCDFVKSRESVFDSRFKPISNKLLDFHIPFERAIPYAQSELDEWPKQDDRFFILSNLLLAAVSVAGFGTLTEIDAPENGPALRGKLAAARACLLGNKLEKLQKAKRRPALVKALHSVASTLSQVFIALLGDPNHWKWPYWKMFDSTVIGGKFDPIARQAGLNFIATVCLHRTGRQRSAKGPGNLTHMVGDLLDFLVQEVTYMRERSPDPIINPHEKNILLDVLKDPRQWKTEGARYCVR